LTVLPTRLAGYIAAVDAEIERLCSATPRYSALYDMLRYHLGWLDARLTPAERAPGKRLRPALCLLIADTLGNGWRAALPAAVAVELVHNFSLVHDDIEDRSPLRRHRPTVWATWGIPHGINAGDALHVLAQQALVEADDLEPSLVVDALRVLNRASRAVCEGQYLDLLWESEPPVSVDDYLEMIERKAARLFECAAQLGALYSGANSEVQRQAALFGNSLGMAFQALDDIIGAWGNETETGKSADLDIASRKKTLPVALAVSGPDSPDRRRLKELFCLARELDPEETAEARGLLEKLGAREQAAQYVQRHRDEALAHLRHPLIGERASTLEEFARSMLPDAGELLA
jgi:geranylgeranyl diphosphate synthase type I